MSLSRPRAVALAIVLAFVATFAAAAPASAHDELVQSSPSSGERLQAPPEEVTLSFTAEVLTVGAIVVVVDADGTDWVDGDLTISEGIVTAPVREGMPEGGYEVRWRVVSSDGHPISGLIPFTVGEGQPLERSSAAETAAPSVAASDQNQGTGEQGALRTVLIGVGGAAVAAAVFALIVIIRRRSRTGGTKGNL